MKFIEIISILIVLFLMPFGGIPQPAGDTFDHLTEANGLSSGVITAILKDGEGFMWFGTQNGLNRYDGYTFKKYLFDDSLGNTLSGNFILSLTIDRKGTMWIGTEGKGLNRYDRMKDNFTSFQHLADDSESLSDNTVRSMIETKSGEFLIGTDKGLNAMNRQTGKFRQIEIKNEQFNLNDLAIHALFEDEDTTLWIGTSEGLIHFNPVGEDFERYINVQADKHSLSNNTINGITRSREGKLIIATNEGLNVYNETGDNFSRYYYDNDSFNSLGKSEVQAMAEDNRGNFWIGSFGGGLIKSRTGSEKTVIYMFNPDDPVSLSNDYINALYYDDAGIHWIGTYGGGIDKIDQVRIRFDFIRHEPLIPGSLPGSDVFALFADSVNLWIGTDQGLSIYNFNNERFTNPRLVSGKNGDHGKVAVYSIISDKEGNSWIGTAGSGLKKLSYKNKLKSFYKFDSFTIEKSTGAAKLAGNEILCLATDYNDNLWVGTGSGLSIMKDGRVISTFYHDPADTSSLADNEVYSLYEDHEGSMWVGTYSGLCKFDILTNKFINFGTSPDDQQKLLKSTIYSIHEDASGLLWLGTDNAGLIAFDPGTGKVVQQYTRNNGLPDNVIYGILGDEEGNLWLSSNSGLIKLIRQEGSDKLTVIRYSTGDWLISDAFNIGAYFRGPDDRLYFGSSAGVTLFYPSNVKGNTYIPPVQITGFDLFFHPVKISDDGSTPLSESITETKKIVLKHNQNVLTFEFAALNYIEPEKNRYAFKMENLEKAWNYSGQNRTAQYLYIPPGDYIFRVKAANNDGIWNEEGTSIEIIIKPPFTQTAWFYILVIAGLIILIWWFLNIRTKRLRTARDKLEKQVQVRTHELRETNKNLQEEIIEREKAEAALKKSEARFRQLIETMNEGFSVQDKKGKINYVNPRLCEMFGYRPEEIIGKSPEEFLDDSNPENLETYRRNRQEGMRKGRINAYELTWKLKDGSTFEAMVSPKPIIDPNEGYTGSVAILTDITDLKNAEKQLLSKNEALNTALEDLKKTQAQLIDSEKMASLGQLTAGVAHEINNPINFVSGNVKPLRRDIKDVIDVLSKYDRIINTLGLSDRFDEIEKLKKEIDLDFVMDEIDQLLDGIGEGAKRTSEIVKGLRNFSRMDEHELKRADIHQGLESTLLILYNKLKQRIDVVKDYGELPEIMCYPGQLNQVFMNILNNGIEAIRGQGTIFIRTWKDQNNIKISIRDTGSGMSREIKKRIFEPFFTTKEPGKGTGLGLAISYGIIEKHGGKIEVESESGKGSEFIITLPIVDTIKSK